MRRIVLFRRKPDADAAAFTAALTTLQSLDARVPEITTWWLQMNPDREGMWDAGLIADFADQDTLHRYENHPAHVEAATAVAAVSDFAIFDSAE